MKLTTVARLTACAVALGLPVVAAGPAIAQTAPQTSTESTTAMAPRCGWLPGANEPYSVGFSGAGIRLRTGPSTTCTVLGLGYAGQSATLRCGAVGDDGWSWYYVRNNSTGVTGFVRGDGLTGVPISTLAC
ncbi:SH3 domain-containing protein [Verrucosispora sp. NA02020]|uniref:SH3 domain-containing protein n=1 Tax=Verrucosispora sp. NA02020 TaxID=2742132 RepID=UPI0015912552|nr:SH3 domain-containing protein [Verrucosispora sp. NA02020]QKW13451.1 SH3 domain-containing protein [Verrucosispora sp. NA02020]